MDPLLLPSLRQHSNHQAQDLIQEQVQVHFLDLKIGVLEQVQQSQHQQLLLAQLVLQLQAVMEVGQVDLESLRSLDQAHSEALQQVLNHTLLFKCLQELI